MSGLRWVPNSLPKRSLGVLPLPGALASSICQAGLLVKTMLVGFMSSTVSISGLVVLAGWGTLGWLWGQGVAVVLPIGVPKIVGRKRGDKTHYQRDLLLIRSNNNGSVALSWCYYVDSVQILVVVAHVDFFQKGILNHVGTDYSLFFFRTLGKC